MKLETITTINIILLDKKANELKDYKASLEKKYDTEWIQKYINDEEKCNLKMLKEDKEYIEKAYEDFVSHDWH